MMLYDNLIIIFLQQDINAKKEKLDTQVKKELKQLYFSYF